MKTLLITAMTLFYSVIAFCSTSILSAPSSYRGESLRLSGFEQVNNSTKALALKATKQGANVTFLAPTGEMWDFSPYVYLICEIENRTSKDQFVETRLNGDYWSTGATYVPAKGTRKFKTLILRKEYTEQQKQQFIRMNGLPGGALRLWCSYTPESISNFTIDFPRIASGDQVVIKNFYLENDYKEFSPQEYARLLPFVDKYGQYIHSNYPGKISSDKQIIAAENKEEIELKKFTGNKEWNEYGGWANGPQLDASGHFRVQKYNNKWWLVDPVGRLFWSHGITCVGGSDGTSVKGRAEYYKYIPYEKSEYAPFISMQRGDTIVSFWGINMMKKWGADYEKKMIDKANRRLKSWNINTIANWSNGKIIAEKKVPYTATLHVQYGHIPPDVFAPKFQENFAQGISRSTAAQDSWCIGYFVDNEIQWGNDTHLAKLAVKGTYKEGKRVFKERLMEKYDNLTALNTVWGSNFDSWDGFMASDSVYNGADEDLRDFTRHFANTYFRSIKEAIKQYAPDKLYMGCRFNYGDYAGNGTQRWIVDISAKYCDIVSFNRYMHQSFSLAPSKGNDFPMIIGEFHFGGLDRGLLHCGLRFGGDQDNRAELYYNYVLNAVENPYIVGTHWFQYNDQAVTGRGDGENYQIGFVNVYDAPNRELVDAARKVGDAMYNVRNK